MLISKIVFNQMKQIVVFIIGSFLLSGCGSFDASERENTLKAKMEDAEILYNKAQYAEAIAVYEEILVDDPSNEEAKVRIAFSYNGLARLGVFDLATGFVNVPASASGSANSVLEFLKIVGLTDAEKAELSLNLAQAAATPTNMTEFRTVFTKANTLHKAWSSLCSMIPRSILNNLAGSTGALQDVYGTQDPARCNNGVLESKPSAAVSIAALFIVMSETAILFQMVLDKDGDGNIDLISELSNSITTITTDNSSLATTPTSEDAAQTVLNTLATSLDTLAGFADSLTGELMQTLFADISAMGLLATLAPGMPAEAVASIRAAVAQFRNQQDNLNSFLSSSVSNTGGLTTNRKLIAEVGRQSSRAIDVVGIAFKSGIGGGAAKTDEELAVLLKTPCDSFDNFLAKYGLADKVRRAKKCSLVSSAT